MLYLKMIIILFVATIVYSTVFIWNVIKLNIIGIPKIFKKDIYENAKYFSNETVKLLVKHNQNN